MGTAWPAATRTPTASAWAGTARARARAVPQHRAGVGGPQPARAGASDRVVPVPRPYPRGDGDPVEQTNCHPFRHGRWLFMHNGFIGDYLRLRRELLLAVDPDVFTGIEGTTDSELMFHLALTFGLEQEPLTALERMAGFVEETGRRHGVAEPLQMTVAASDGERLYAVRYASGPVVNSLFVTADASAVRALHPDDERFRRSPTRRARSSPSRSATCPASGARCRPAPRSSSSPARTRCSRSRRARPRNTKAPLTRGLQCRSWITAELLRPRTLCLPGRLDTPGRRDRPPAARAGAGPRLESRRTPRPSGRSAVPLRLAPGLRDPPGLVPGG